MQPPACFDIFKHLLSRYAFIMDPFGIRRVKGKESLTHEFDGEVRVAACDGVVNLIEAADCEKRGFLEQDTRCGDSIDNGERFCLFHFIERAVFFDMFPLVMMWRAVVQKDTAMLERTVRIVEAC